MPTRPVLTPHREQVRLSAAKGETWWWPNSVGVQARDEVVKVGKPERHHGATDPLGSYISSVDRDPGVLMDLPEVLLANYLVGPPAEEHSEPLQRLAQVTYADDAVKLHTRLRVVSARVVPLVL